MEYEMEELVPIVAKLAEKYTGCEAMAANIDYVGGKRTATFAAQAIQHYCR